MASFKVLKTLTIGPVSIHLNNVLALILISKDLSMDIKLDEAEPEDSIDRWVAETIGVGAADSEPVNIPPHWHKVKTHLNVSSADELSTATLGLIQRLSRIIHSTSLSLKVNSK